MTKTNTIVTFLVLSVTALCACGDSSGSASDGSVHGGSGGSGGSGGIGGGGSGGTGGGTGSCNLNTTCGGTLDGTWQIDTTCVVGNVVDMLSGQENLPSACSNLFQTGTLSATGTVMYASGMETDNLTMTIHATVLYTSACVSALDNTTVTLTAAMCTSLQSGLLNGGHFSAATCSFTGGNCACSVVSQQQTPTTPLAYTVSGSRISYANGSSPMDYCVQGSTMSLQSVESGVTIFNTAHKL
jgi:hypothetical protein